MIERARNLAGRMTPTIHRPNVGGLEWVFLAIIAVAAGMRLWELNGRTMHYDEAIHLHFAWKLAQGVEFVHSPWMHGPLQIELVAALIKFVGDTDFLARLPYALFGVALVAMPYFLREQLGSKGAVCAAIILAMSPTLLYFSRFGRNDILMAVWALLLLIGLWRYTATSRSRYLYWSALVVALMLASKETSYFIILFFGVAALALGFRQLWAFLMRRCSWSDINGAGGFFILLATLTLPQAAAMLAVIQRPLGLTLVAKDSGSTGETGAPVWTEPFVTLPVWESPLWLGMLAAAALAGVMAGLAWWKWRGPTPVSGLILAGAVVVATAASIAAVAVTTVQPLGQPVASLLPNASAANMVVVDFGAAAALILVAVVILRLEQMSMRRITLMLGPAVLLTLLWLFLLSSNVMLTGAALPDSAAATADLEAGRIAVNYLVPALALLGLFAVSVAVGVSWGGGVWLIAAGIFYAVWTALYTTLFTNTAGLFTGSWQSLGYWLAQQEEARGESALVLLRRRVNRVRAAGAGVRAGRRRLAHQAAGTLWAGAGRLDNRNAGGVHDRRRKDALAAGEHHRAAGAGSGHAAGSSCGWYALAAIGSAPRVADGVGTDVANWRRVGRLAGRRRGWGQHRGVAGCSDSATGRGADLLVDESTAQRREGSGYGRCGAVAGLRHHDGDAGRLHLRRF